jgi:hypothetical protein
MWRLSVFLCGTGAILQIRCLIKAESSQMCARRGALGPKPAQESPNKPSCREARLCYIPSQLKIKRDPFMAHESDYQPGSMDISAHKKAYAGFLTGSKWVFGFVMLIMIFLAVFRTHG